MKKVYYITKHGDIVEPADGPKIENLRGAVILNADGSLYHSVQFRGVARSTDQMWVDSDVAVLADQRAESIRKLVTQRDKLEKRPTWKTAVALMILGVTLGWSVTWFVTVVV